jgi:putative ABC transport system substrate-binding protein
MNRREIMVGLGSAAAWPVLAKAQQQAMPVIGYLSSVSPPDATAIAPFRQGLSEAGFVEKQNVEIEYRWAEGRTERLPALAAELVRRQVQVVVAGGETVTALAARAATSVTPIVFVIGSDPVEFGLVASLAQPGGHITGVTVLTVEVSPKRLQLLHEVVPAARAIARIGNPTNPGVGLQTKEFEIAARSFGLDLLTLDVTSPSEIVAAFASLARRRDVGLIVSGERIFLQELDQIIALAARYSVPAIYPYREAVIAGGLMSYGPRLDEAFRLAGTYAGRILRGEKPSDLPVQQSTKVELTINLRTAKGLGLTIPLPLLGRADEVIE